MKARLSRRRLLEGACAVAGAAAVGATTMDAAEARAAVAGHRFRYCLNTATLRGQRLGLVQEIEVTAGGGYDGIEPWTGSIHRYVQSGGSLKDLRKRCEDLGLTVCSAIGFSQWVVDDDGRRAKGIEQLRRDMDVLARIGGTHIAAAPAGANRRGATLDLDRAAERYRAILELGRRSGVIPQIEVWGTSANLSHVAEAIYVAAKAAHPDACVLADAFHMYKGGVEAATLRLLGRHAVHCFHMNDYPAEPPREQIRDSQRIWPGDGIAPLKEILRYFAENHCRVVLSLELFNPTYWRMPAGEAAKTGLAKMKAVVKAAGLA